MKHFFALFSLNNKPLAATLFFFILLTGTQAQVVNIDPNYTALLPRPGWRLIFSDEFGVFDPSVWDRSTPGDDLHPYGHPEICSKNGNTCMNEDNVLTPSGGALPLRTKSGEAMNACGFSGAEIKTFSNGIWSDPNDPFRHWKLPINSYLEARIKVPECKGVGGGFWLYGGTGWDGGGPPYFTNRFFEVDMFELYGNVADQFQANIHYGKKYNDPTHQNHPHTVEVRDMFGQPVDLEQQFLTFGVHHDNEAITMYLNDVEYKKYFFSGFGNAKHNTYLRPLPFNIRLGTGNSTLRPQTPAECEYLPTLFEVDYVRIFMPAEDRAIKYLNGSAHNFCTDHSWGDGEKVKVTYLPGASYQWDATGLFNFESLVQDRAGNNEEWWVRVVPGTPVGTYTVNLTVTFPNGVQEVLPFQFSVFSGQPQAPQVIQVFQDVNAGTYYLGIPIGASTTGYEWSDDNGATWHKQPNPEKGTDNIWWDRVFFNNSNLTQVHDICVRSYNNCHTSAPYCTQISIPPNGCDGCPLRMGPPREVFVEQIPGFDSYRLKVKKSDRTDGYDWGYDTDYWYREDNVSGTDFNYFGDFAAGTPPFTIYVRGSYNDTLTHIYSQEIIIPDSTNAGAAITHPDVPAMPSPVEPHSLTLENEDDTPYAYWVFNPIGQLVGKGTHTGVESTIPYQRTVSGIYIVLRRDPITGKYTAKKQYISN